MKQAFIYGRSLIDGQILSDKKIIFSDHIEAILDLNEPHGDIPTIDLKGAYLFPGFVDVHTHGACGADVMDATPQSLHLICSSLAKYGVSKFLATTMTMSETAIRKALDNIREVLNDDQGPRGAQIIGVHLEGPFISERYAGAQDKSHIIKPNWNMLLDYRDLIKIITIAVEEDEDFEFIHNNPGIQLSIGHTNADFETAIKSYDLGVTHCTHCFNAMSPLHHREPGVVGACFAKKYDTEFIADGVHIHPGFLETFVRIIGKEQAILITDSMRACGMPEGEYTLGGQKVILQGKASRLENGSLAGSILTMDQAIRNMRQYTKLSLPDIIQMASFNPARSIHMEHRLGSIKEGNAADFVIMNDGLEVLSTFADGQCIYDSTKNSQK